MIGNFEPECRFCVVRGQIGRLTIISMINISFYFIYICDRSDDDSGGPLNALNISNVPMGGLRSGVRSNRSPLKESARFAWELETALPRHEAPKDFLCRTNTQARAVGEGQRKH
jgi:hypothetical protein